MKPKQRLVFSRLCVVLLLAIGGLLLWGCQASYSGRDSFLDPAGAGLGRWEATPSDENAYRPDMPIHEGIYQLITPAPADDLHHITADPNSEIWIIVKPANPAEIEPAEPQGPGGGAMLAVIPSKPQGENQEPGEPEFLPMPLKHTDVKASVAGYIATVDVTQQFHNPFAEKIEAVYQFPLPQDAAVSRFVMTIGDRQIHGIVREKEEAEELYLRARARGLRASILTQVRPNLFEQKVANIEPGQQIDIALRYFNTLSYSDGWYTFAYPMVVAPRYNPPYSEDAVVPVGVGAAQSTAGTTVTQHLRPDQRTGHDIALTLDIDAGVAIEETRSVTHAIDTKKLDGDHLRVALSPNDTLPNKDFVFAFRVAGKTMKQGLVTHVDDKGDGYFTLMLYPPAELEGLKRQPMEMVFVLDCSGSMRGEPMQQSKDAMKFALRSLQRGDTFQVIRFSDDSSAFGDKPVAATPDNIRRAIDYVNRLEGSGGTAMIEGIKTALDFPHDPQRFRTVTFLTDGQIGNEQEILSAMQPRLRSARVFSFGVGNATNRYLLERMAIAGRGAAAYLLPGDSGADVMRLYFERISHPAMTDLQIDFGQAKVSDVYPSRAPDLLVGRPVILTGRYDPAKGDLAEQVIRVSGRAGPHGVALTLQPRGNGDAAASHDALAKVWARRRIADLVDRAVAEGDPALFKDDILATALGYQLMSNYTAFLAIDTSETTAGDHGTTVVQPLPMPEGVRYDSTVGE